MLEFNNIYYQVEEKDILKNINLHIKAGEITTIIGPNGSGKSSLINLLSLNKNKYSGEIKYLGDDYNPLSDYKKISVLHQFSQIPEHLTVREFLQLCMLGPKPIYKQLTAMDYQTIEELIELCECTQIANIQVKNLSGGERQRLLICSTLLQQPKLLILDEPTTFLDVKFQHLILDLLRKLKDKYQMTIVMVVHDISQCYLADNIVIMKAGEIVFSGLSKELTAQILSSSFEIKFKKHYNHFVVEKSDIK